MKGNFDGNRITGILQTVDETAYQTLFRNRKLIKKFGIACFILIAAAIIGLYIMNFLYLGKSTPVYYDIEITEEEMP